MEDGKICSCSDDTTIKVWDNYKCIQTLKGHNWVVNSIIEMNNCIISASYDDSEMKIWDESTYQCILSIQDAFCNSSNGLSKLDDNTLILGGIDKLYFVDIETYEINKFQDKSLEGFIVYM